VSFDDRYDVFVWPAYAVTALTFVWMLVSAVTRARRWRRRVERLEHEEGR